MEISGAVANLLLEAPSVNEEGKVNGWLTKYAPSRSWAIDMAGFAINLELLLRAKKYVSVDRSFYR